MGGSHQSNLLDNGDAYGVDTVWSILYVPFHPFLPVPLCLTLFHSTFGHYMLICYTGRLLTLPIVLHNR